LRLIGDDELFVVFVYVFDDEAFDGVDESLRRLKRLFKFKLADEVDCDNGALFDKAVVEFEDDWRCFNFFALAILLS
jgi:hypothetical protein